MNEQGLSKYQQQQIGHNASHLWQHINFFYHDLPRFYLKDTPDDLLIDWNGICTLSRKVMSFC